MMPPSCGWPATSEESLPAAAAVQDAKWKENHRRQAANDLAIARGLSRQPG